MNGNLSRFPIPLSPIAAARPAINRPGIKSNTRCIDWYCSQQGQIHQQCYTCRIPFGKRNTRSMLTGFEFILAGLAAVVAGAVNALAGGGTLITFPMLTFLGIPVVAANITNTVALCPG